LGGRAGCMGCDLRVVLWLCHPQDQQLATRDDRALPELSLCVSVERLHSDECYNSRTGSLWDNIHVWSCTTILMILWVRSYTSWMKITLQHNEALCKMTAVVLHYTSVRELIIFVCGFYQYNIPVLRIGGFIPPALHE